MKISILISNYNKEKFIEECIASALNQNYKNLEVIVIDNNSTDDSLKIITKFSDKILIKNKNRESEFSASNQIESIIEAFKISTGDIICLLDGDDFFLPNKISTINQYFLENPKIDIIFDTPRVLVKDKILPIKLKKKFFFNSWPSTVPTSGISFKKNFFDLCLKSNLLIKYPILEADFRLTFFSKKINNKYIHTSDYLTFYRQVDDGIMSKLKKFSKRWWFKRLEAHCFIREYYKNNNIKCYLNYDFYLTKIIVYFLKKKVN
tara:strand:+ start:2174 stop:2962 length:789 start_codon:yes stop_codon:yes gene_type:complete